MDSKKNMKKTIIAFLLAVVMLAEITGGGAGVSTANAACVYNAEAALAYARAHWNDGVGQCAEFVSKCLRAGGLDIPVIRDCATLYKTIASVTGVTATEVKLNANGNATLALNLNTLAPGDVIMSWCYNHQSVPHFMLIGGFDSKGQAGFYAHNRAHNNDVFSPKTGSCRSRSCRIGVMVFHLAGCGFNGVEHSFDEGVVTTTAGRYREGVLTYTCVNCGKTHPETIPAIGVEQADALVSEEEESTEKDGSPQAEESPVSVAAQKQLYRVSK